MSALTRGFQVITSIDFVNAAMHFAAFGRYEIHADGRHQYGAPERGSSG